MTVSEKQNKEMKSIVALVKNTWELYRCHVSLFIGYSAWMLIPMVVSVLLSVTFGSDHLEITELIVVTLDILIGVWVMISLIQVIPLAQGKKRIDTRILSTRSWHLAIPFLLLTILLSIGTIAGLILLIIPGIIFATYTTFASVILILEQTKVLDAIKGSVALVKTRFWAIFTRVLFGSVILLIPYLVAMLLIAGILLMAHNGDVEALVSSPATLIEQILARLVDVCLLPLFVIFNIVLYQNAKETKQ